MRTVNRYVVEPVDNDPPLSDGRVRTWIVWDRQREVTVADPDTRAAARKALAEDFVQEQIPAKEKSK